ncbi:YdcF family protein [Vibrio anguillarum]|uniref:YdcF family protein n=1 Tax=Vibrio anguillarum TaxID=55601 RepID=A0AAW4B1A6_VIBAN|nr:YdcF family protein [Vibrio anguillarum]AEH34480.1 hypothetical protein VAA_01639 [Vibrio anguillarum 775]AGU59818.1 hypothetical protein N175_14915 [Vibrio anguillarum M3]ASF93820.1 hypothetical protein CEA93_17625 [Vibrio anguillarum]ATA51246.1 hypothetical protein CLI14_16315 [Vibrio anguillarum]AVT66602.1 hypothetical protein B5S57_05305 [Vibrio anguillarum]
MVAEHLYIVLGKRLVDQQLTLEGRSRVDGLVKALQRHDIDHSVIALCGGLTLGQQISEAKAMYHYLQSELTRLNVSLSNNRILLEEHSTSTVENIENVALELQKNGDIDTQKILPVTFISNDYHLQRIFEIQQLMDEQGLLRVLKQRCEMMGITLAISPDLHDHLAVKYPYTHLAAELFLLVDQLTTYRVYLEGVVAGSFLRDLTQVRAIPYQIAYEAILAINHKIADNPKWVFVRCLTDLLMQCINATKRALSVSEIQPYLILFDSNLTLLNRYLDPENPCVGRWWRQG